MSLTKGVFKFKDAELSYSDWEGSLPGGDGGIEAQAVKDHRNDIVRYGTIDDDAADYNFDNYSLISIRGQGWFLLRASGCSCPSAQEVWGVTFHSKTLARLRTIFDIHVSGVTYGTPIRQVDQFNELFDFAEEQTKLTKVKG